MCCRQYAKKCAKITHKMSDKRAGKFNFHKRGDSGASKPRVVKSATRISYETQIRRTKFAGLSTKEKQV